MRADALSCVYYSFLSSHVSLSSTASPFAPGGWFGLVKPMFSLSMMEFKFTTTNLIFGSKYFLFILHILSIVTFIYFPITTLRPLMM